MTYSPEKIFHQNFLLRSRALGLIYNTERDIQRLDSRIKHSPYSAATHMTLKRGDGVGITNRKDLYPDIYTLMRVEAAAHVVGSEQNNNKTLRKALAPEAHPTIDLALESYRFMETIDHVTDDSTLSLNLSPEIFLNLYAWCEDNIAVSKDTVFFRKTPYQTSQDIFESDVYLPPSPKRLNALVTDYCNFISSDTLSPLLQASIAQFQFEALKPFDRDLDRMERLTVHYIFARRKLVESIIFPISFFPAKVKEDFYDLLMPYLADTSIQASGISPYVEKIALYTVDIAQDLLLFVISLHNAIQHMVEKWRARLGRVERGSATELLLREIAGRPVLTITQARELIGKSFSTTSDAFERLEKAGIVIPGQPIKRSRTFEAPEAIFFHDSLYRKYLPKNALAREISPPHISPGQKLYKQSNL